MFIVNNLTHLTFKLICVACLGVPIRCSKWLQRDPLTPP